MCAKLQSNEKQLVGNWKQIGGKVAADETCQRIQWLIEKMIEKIGTDVTVGTTSTRIPKPEAYGSLPIPTVIGMREPAGIKPSILC